MQLRAHVQAVVFVESGGRKPAGPVRVTRRPHMPQQGQHRLFQHQLAACRHRWHLRRRRLLERRLRQRVVLGNWVHLLRLLFARQFCLLLPAPALPALGLRLFSLLPPLAVLLRLLERCHRLYDDDGAVCKTEGRAVKVR